MKDIIEKYEEYANFLEEQIEEGQKNYYNTSFRDGELKGIRNILGDLNQLDEPEDSLQVSPVIPQFVADFLIGKEDYMLYELFDDEWLYKEHDPVAKWLYDNDELTNKQREIDLVMARYGGYEVEEEPKYIIDLDDEEFSDGYHYLKRLKMAVDGVDVIAGGLLSAVTFESEEEAQLIAEYVGGRVVELEQ